MLQFVDTVQIFISHFINVLTSLYSFICPSSKLEFPNFSFCSFSLFVGSCLEVHAVRSSPAFCLRPPHSCLEDPVLKIFSIELIHWGSAQVPHIHLCISSSSSCRAKSSGSVMRAPQIHGCCLPLVSPAALSACVGIRARGSEREGEF